MARKMMHWRFERGGRAAAGFAGYLLPLLSALCLLVSNKDSNYYW